MILQHRGCGGELDDRRRCLACGADVTVTEAVAIRTGARARPPTPGRAGSGGGPQRSGTPRPRLSARGRAGARVATVPAMSDDTAWLDATAQAELVRTKEVSPAELVDGAIARIEKLNPRAQRGHPRALRPGPGRGGRARCPTARSAACPSC